MYSNTFFPFLVGLTDRIARSLNARLSTCRTVGSLAICMATMWRAPWSTASTVEKCLQGITNGKHL